MKKITILLFALMLMVACNSGKSAKEAKDMIAKNDCYTCHKIDEPLTGPPYAEVAKRYANSPDTIVNYLADKVITGGKGKWGEIFMTPHYGISKDDARAMVKYILSLNKKQ